MEIDEVKKSDNKESIITVRTLKSYKEWIATHNLSELLETP